MYLALHTRTHVRTHIYAKILDWGISEAGQAWGI